MNPFEHYGISHLSASSINTFTASPASFILSKVLKHYSPVGAAAHRGTAVEAGIMHGLLENASDEDSIAVAERTFRQKAALTTDPRKEKEENSLADMVRTGLAELRPYGRPSATQGKIEWKVEGLAVPLIGYFDAEWEQHGILLDLKTTHALPSKIATNHARQVSLYTACRGNADARLTYVTTKKVATYQLESARAHLAAIERVALTIQRFLSVSADPQELIALTAPDTDSFYFSDPAARQVVFQHWGY